VSDTEEFLGDVDEDLEAMQGTVYLLQQELKDSKDRIHAQQLEIELLRQQGTLANPTRAVPHTGGAPPHSVTPPSESKVAPPGDSNGTTASHRLRTAGLELTDRKDIKILNQEIHRTVSDVDKMDVEVGESTESERTSDKRTSDTMCVARTPPSSTTALGRVALRSTDVDSEDDQHRGVPGVVVPGGIACPGGVPGGALPGGVDCLRTTMKIKVEMMDTYLPNGTDDVVAAGN
jgi:hypothetical protein